MKMKTIINIYKKLHLLYWNINFYLLIYYFIKLINRSKEKLEIPREYQVTQMYIKRFMFIAELNEEIFEKMVPHFLTDTFKHVKDVSINQ